MNNLTALFGTDIIQTDEPLRLKAGPISLLFQNGFIRSVHLGEHEIVQRVYMALRDKMWNTIHPVFSPFVLKKSEASFHLQFEAEHTSGEINFMWHGEILGEENGTITFSMKGKSNSTFQRNRIGFCVLHPLQLCTGRACTIETTSNTTIKGTFPVFVTPYQPFTDIHKIIYKVPSVATISVQFEGEAFEMEDQRNWTDASYKTYSTPLSLPLPVTIPEGTVIEQKVIISVITEQLIEFPIPKTIEIRIPPNNKNHSHMAHGVGTALTSSEIITPFAVEMLHKLSLSHLRIDIHCDSSSFIQDMESAASHCLHLGVPAELALHFSNDFESELDMLALVLHTSQIPLSHTLIYKKNVKVTPPELIERVIPLLRSFAPHALIGAGTNSYFVEINRNHPSTEFLDLICYAATPQVHTFDNEAIMENLPGIAETLRTVALFQGNATPAISPITLRPRKNPSMPEKFSGPDPRQKGLFCAAWTLGNLMHCLDSGAYCLTYFETTGESGLMPSNEESVYAVYHLIATVNEMTGGNVKICSCNDQSRIASIVFEKGLTLLMLVANLSDSPQQVTIFDLPASINFSILDETTFGEATSFPQLWRIKKGRNRYATGPFHIFDILPYGILRIEADLAK